MGKLIDLTGQTFGELLVLSKAEKPKNSSSTSAFWLCKCSCGNEKVVSGNSLKQGKTKSCGCLNTQKKDLDSLIGKKFGRLTVLKRTDPSKPVKGKDAYWLCECDCGNQVAVMGKSLKNGKTLSCGCYRHEILSRDLTGQRFGKLVVLERAGVNHEKRQLWKCKCDCGNIHITNERNLILKICQSCGCLSSKGEMEIEKILKENNLSYIKQYSYHDLKGLNGGLLRFDFAILKDGEVQYLIEFQGEQHYKNSGSWFDNPIEHDKIKQEYCKKNNIPLILIPYWKRNNITIKDLLIN